MKTITKQKPVEEVMGYIEKCRSVYVIGCGTCATLCHTGGKSEVLAMKDKIEASGRKVTGWMVIPTACDELTKYALQDNAQPIKAADCILAMTCAIGVQTINFHLKEPKNLYPALNTMFIGTEDKPGHFAEVCLQCGACVLGRTAAICPLVRCAKSLLNGPCGGSSNGRCEISPDVPCAWQLIHDRMKEEGRLDEMDQIEPVKDWSVSVTGGPRKADVEAECALPPAEAGAAAK
ncbi:MAG: methylenetetrahydrofolate reductase C-terminal domain-containing protein [Chloroflexota bacterium]